MSTNPKEIFPRRLHQARTMRGLSLRGLAEALHGAVSHNALAKYENGEMMPNSTVLVALADALEQSTDFFFRPFTLQLSDVRFRKRVRLSANMEKAVREQAVEYFERYREAEELVGDVRTYEPPFKAGQITNPDHAEEYADELRKKWKLGRDPIPDVLELLETKGIKVYEVASDDRAVDGFCANTEAGPVIVLASWANQHPLRKRMTASHELAHLVLPIPDNLDPKVEEQIVNRFAGAFLMPAETFTAAFGKLRHTLLLSELIAIKLTFGASIMAIMMRAQQLGLISPTVHQRFWMYVSQHGWRKQGEPGDDQFQEAEQHNRFQQLVYRAVAEQQISISKGAALLKKNLGAFREELREVTA